MSIPFPRTPTQREEAMKTDAMGGKVPCGHCGAPMTGKDLWLITVDFSNGMIVPLDEAEGDNRPGEASDLPIGPTCLKSTCLQRFARRESVRRKNWERRRGNEV